ncbi:hypothetical protein ACLOJK_018398 [Asimina triloba]
MQEAIAVDFFAACKTLRPVGPPKISKPAIADLRRTASPINCNPDDLSDVVRPRRLGRPPASPKYLLGIKNRRTLSIQKIPKQTKKAPRRTASPTNYDSDKSLFSTSFSTQDLVVSPRDLRMKISDGDANMIKFGFWYVFRFLTVIVSGYIGGYASI